LPTPISVVTGDEIAQKGYQRVDQLFRGDVPGAAAWDFGPLNYTSTIAIRGASQLSGTSTVKTLIDGVEVSDPAFVAMIDPNSIERIEITRGPQASTIYGAGALNGVMQIFTKRGELGLPHPAVAARLSAGGIGGFDGQSTAAQTDNAVSVVGGSSSTSYSVGGSYRRVGEWLPSYRSTDWGVFTGGQTRQGPLTLSASARYGDKSLDYPWDTRLRSYTFFSQPQYLTQRIREQTYGVAAALQATPNWQHSLSLGYDQIYLSSLQTQARLTTPGDTLLTALVSHEPKTSLLYHTDLTLHFGTAAAAVVTPAPTTMRTIIRRHTMQIPRARREASMAKHLWASCRRAIPATLGSFKSA
jgi:outer membrane receptor protein involved in Fe transport